MYQWPSAAFFDRLMGDDWTHLFPAPPAGTTKRPAAVFEKLLGLMLVLSLRLLSQQSVSSLFLKFFSQISSVDEGFRKS